MLQSGLMDELNTLSDCFRALIDSNEYFRLGLDVKTQDEEAELNEQQEADIRSTLKEAESKLAEMEDMVQSILWPKYVKEEVERIIEAERVNEAPGKVLETRENLQCFEEHLILSKK